MKLTEHFTLEELTRSETAARRGLDNTPPSHIINNLRVVAETLEKVREGLGGKPVRVLSGYRSKVVNISVGGSAKSSHLDGMAVDFIVPGVPVIQVCLWCASHLENFDQIIYEFGEGGWCHLGLGIENRKQQLTASKIGNKTVYSIGFIE